MHLPGRKTGPEHNARGELSIVRPRPSLGTAAGPRLSFRFAQGETSPPRAPLLTPHHPGCTPGKRAASLGKELDGKPVPKPGAGAARGQQEETPARQHPPESSSPMGQGGRGIRLGRGGVFIISGRWVVLLRFNSPAVCRSLPVQRSLRGRGTESLSAASLHPPSPGFATPLPSPSLQ